MIIYRHVPLLPVELLSLHETTGDNTEGTTSGLFSLACGYNVSEDLLTSRTLPVPCSCCMAACRSQSDTCGNSSTPLWMRKHLKPATPAWIMGRSSSYNYTSVTVFVDAFGVIPCSWGCVHLVQAGSLYLVARDHTSPKGCVHKTLPCRLLQLLVEMIECGGWRNAVSEKNNKDPRSVMFCDKLSLLATSKASQGSTCS